MNNLKIHRSVILFSLIILTCALSVVAALRLFGMDKDYQEYLYFFQEVDLDYAGRFEPGFVVFSIVFKKLFDSFGALLFGVAIISLFVKFYLFSRLPYFFFWVILYIPMFLFIHEMTQVRVAMAMAFGYLALYSAYSGSRFTVRLLLLLVAASFQMTIFVLAPFVFFWNRLCHPSFIIVLMVTLVPAGLLNAAGEALGYLNPMVLAILNDDQQVANPVSVKNILLILVALIGLFSIRKIPPRILPWYYMSLMGLGLWYGLMAIPVFAHRLFELAMLSYFFWVPYLPKKPRFLAMAVLLVLGVSLIIYSIFIDLFFL